MVNDKVLASASAAVAMIPDGATVMVGGFGRRGVPEGLILALRDRGTRNLTVISHDPGADPGGLGVMVRSGQIRKIVSSHVGEDPEFERRYLSGDLEVELVPPRTLSERIRAASAGLTGFFTPSGYGTRAAQGRQSVTIDGRCCVLETPLGADFALVRGWKGDRHGNIAYRRTPRLLDPAMATAARRTIVEVERLVEPGQLAPGEVATPGLFVTGVVVGARRRRRHGWS
ncbi:MAG: CoA transferase subunit A [Vicinamibacterales bacterium]